jgi:hypothetical protein
MIIKIKVAYAFAAIPAKKISIGKNILFQKGISYRGVWRSDGRKARLAKRPSSLGGKSIDFSER